MPRAIDDDFSELMEFISSYSLENVIHDQEFLSCATSGHKSYVSLLYLSSQSQFLAKRGALTAYHQKIETHSITLAYLQESVSDVGSGLFCCFHGAYKPANMALRSSIENFLRFSAGIFDKKAVETTSVFDLFDIAKTTPAFIGIGKSFHSRLRSVYSDLCKDTHTSTLENMAGIHALNHFPSFEGQSFDLWSKNAKLVVTAIGSVIVLMSPDILLKAHFKAQEIIELIVAPQVKKALWSGAKFQ
jgi:hypothetical protein